MRALATKQSAINQYNGLGNQLWDIAGARPSLDLQLANNKSLIDAVTGQNLVTFTRASSGTYVGSDGLLKTATTNLLLQSEDLSSATWIKSSGVTATLDSSQGLPFTGAKVYRVDYSGAAISISQNITFVAANYSASVWIKGTAGETIRFAGQSGVNAANYTLTGDWQRLTTTWAATAGTLGYGLNTSSGATARTIYVAAPQLEQSSTVGEYVKTTSTINSAPRFDHDPTTGESLGLLVEEGRTNSIRNNTMVGAVAGTPGTLPTNWIAPLSPFGLSREVVGMGIEDGINYIDIKYSGTTTSAGAANIVPDDGITASSGQSWTSSLYLKLAGGSTVNTTLIHRIRQAASGSFNGATDQSVTPTVGSLKDKRFSVTLSSAASGTTSLGQYLILSWSGAGLAIDITLRIGLPQLEQGAFATSPILTSGTAATRAADVASISGSNFSSWYRQDEGALFLDAASAQSVAATNVGAVINDGTLNNRIELDARAGSLGGAGRVTVTSGGAVTFDTGNSSSPAFAVNTFYKQGTSYKLDSFAYSFNGGVAQTDTSGGVPTAPNRMEIGARLVSGQPLNGTIRRLTYWPQRLPNETLQGITQ